MKKVLIILVLLFPVFAFAAITRDTNSTINTTNDPVTWTHTGSTSTPPSVGVVGIFVNDAGGDTISSVTWGGTAMTQVRKHTNGSGSYYSYYIGSTSQDLSDARTISVDLTASELVRAVSETYTGTDTTTPVNVSVTSTNGATPITTNFTPTVANTYQYNFVIDNVGGVNHTCNSNCSLLTAFTNVSGSDFGPITRAEATSTAVNTANGNNISLLMALQEPLPAATTGGRRRAPVIIFGGFLLPLLFWRKLFT